MIKRLNDKGLHLTISKGKLEVFNLYEDKIILIANLIENDLKLFESDIDLHTLSLINRFITQLKEME